MSQTSCVYSTHDPTYASDTEDSLSSSESDDEVEDYSEEPEPEEAGELMDRLRPIWCRYHVSGGQGNPMPGVQCTPDGPKGVRRSVFFGNLNSCDELYYFCVALCRAEGRGQVPPVNWWMDASTKEILTELNGPRYWLYFTTDGDQYVYLNSSLAPYIAPTPYPADRVKKLYVLGCAFDDLSGSLGGYAVTSDFRGHLAEMLRVFLDIERRPTVDLFCRALMSYKGPLEVPDVAWWLSATPDQMLHELFGPRHEIYFDRHCQLRATL